MTFARKFTFTSELTTFSKTRPTNLTAFDIDMLSNQAYIIQTNSESKQRSQMKNWSLSTYLRNLLRSERELDVHCRH